MPSDGLFFRQKGPSRDRLDAERREEVGAHEESLHVLGLVPANEVGGPPFERGEVLERTNRSPEIEVVGRRDGLAPVLVGRFGEAHERDPIDVGHRERTEHERVKHREDRRVGAKTQRERQHDDGAHRRALQDAATGVTRFEDKGSHQGVSGRLRWQRGKIACGARGSRGPEACR